MTHKKRHRIVGTNMLSAQNIEQAPALPRRIGIAAITLGLGGAVVANTLAVEPILEAIQYGNTADTAHDAGLIANAVALRELANDQIAVALKLSLIGLASAVTGYVTGISAFAASRQY